MKKIFKRNIFGLFSILDLIIISAFVLVLLVCYIVMTSNNNKIINPRNTKITYTIVVPEIEQSVVDSVSIGDVLYDVRNNTEIGSIVNINVENSYIYVYNYEEKLYHKNIIKDKFNLHIQIESVVDESESTLLINDLDIKSGSSIEFKSKEYSIAGKILNISR